LLGRIWLSIMLKRAVAKSGADGMGMAFMVKR
jgi:hypothetical protein